MLGVDSLVWKIKKHKVFQHLTYFENFKLQDFNIKFINTTRKLKDINAYKLLLRGTQIKLNWIKFICFHLTIITLDI